MNTQRVLFKWLAVVILSTMFIQSALILPSVSAQAVSTPTTEQDNQPITCNAEPCPVTSSSSIGTNSLQTFTATGSVTGVTDPTLIPNPNVYDFSGDAEFSAPGTFPGGTFSGDRQVRVVGESWYTWNPQIDGKHVLFAFSGTVDVLFTSPQMGVVVKAEPNNAEDWFNITIEAFDNSGASLGSFTQSINGNGGAAFLGVISTSDDIAKITLSSDPAAYGFAFSDVTYGSSVALSCSGIELSHIAIAVKNVVGEQEYCGNHYDNLSADSLITLPPGQDAFQKFNTLAKNARHEVDFVTMGWDPARDDNTDSPGEIFLNGVKDLYEQVKDPEAYDLPADYYSDGVRIRILLGLKYYNATGYQDQRLIVIKDLERLGIDRSPVGLNWTVEVATYRNAKQNPDPILGSELSGTHGHVKLMIVDAETVITGGYNMHYNYLDYPDIENPVHDMGVQTSGPIAFNTLQVFDSLWTGAYRCNQYVVDRCTNESLITGPIFHDSAILTPTITGNNVAFSLFRDDTNKTSDNAISSAIMAANSEVNIIQNRFLNPSIWNPPQYVTAALVPLVWKDEARVHLLVSGQGVDLVINANGVCNLFTQLLRANPLNLLHLDVRFSAFNTPIHTKALSIDDIFTIIGSQNFDQSAWGDLNLDLDLAEYNMAIDGIQAATDFQGKFTSEWNASNPVFCLNIDASPVPGPLFSQSATTAVIQNAVNQAPPGSIIFIPAGVYTESVTIDKPLALIGAGANQTIIQPDGNEPAFRVTSSDVTISSMKISEGAGYGIELIDSSPSSLKNIQINHVVFENNAQGGVLAQGLISGSPMNYAIENNTFIGGADGIAINMIEAQADASIIRNNIFSAQSNAPIHILSTNDSHVEYSYNLFDDCGLGTCTANWKQGNLNSLSSAHDNLFDLNPLFASPENGAYQLSTGSPAIDTGDPELLHEFFYDGDNDGFVQIDIGAFEYAPVTNVAPVVNAGIDQTIDLGNSLTVNVTYTDADNSENHSARVDWGDEIIEDVPVNMTGPGAGNISGEHTYSSIGNYTIEVCVTDVNGGVGCDTLLVTVAPPLPDVDAGVDISTVAGTPVQFSGVINNINPTTIQWNFGDGSAASGTLTPLHTYVNSGLYTVTLTVTDSSGLAYRDTLLVTVTPTSYTLVLQLDGTSGIETYILNSSATSNYGTAATMGVGEDNSGNNKIARSLLKFDLSALPANATITSATLSLWTSQDLSSNTRTIRVYRLKRAFNETQATWNIAATGTNWQTAGASGANDCESTGIGSVQILHNEPLNMEKQISLTPAKIQEMRNGTFVNNGFIIAADTETNDRFAYKTSDNTTATQPKLVIQYTVPSTPDLIFADGFESGDFSRWSMADWESGNLTVSTQSAAVGSKGMQAVITDTGSMQAQSMSVNTLDSSDLFYFNPNSVNTPHGLENLLAGTSDMAVYDNTPINEKHYDARFYFNPNSINLPNGQGMYLFSGSDAHWVFCLYLERQGIYYRLSLCGEDDSLNWLENKFVYINNGWQAIEIEWQAANAPGANNGYMKLFINNVLVDTMKNLDTDTRSINDVTLGVSGIPVGTTGTVYFDAFDSRRSSHIGLDANGPALQPPLTNLVFLDGFESGDLTSWTQLTTDGGNLSVSPNAGMFGSYGLQALINDTNRIYAKDLSPAAETHYSARMYFDPHSVSIPNGQSFYILANDNLKIRLKNNSGTYQLMASIYNDSGIWVDGTPINISNSRQLLELEWKAASANGANDGYLKLWLNDVLVDTIATVDNDIRIIEDISIGAGATYVIPVGTSGTIYFDSFESRNGGHIGP